MINDPRLLPLIAEQRIAETGEAAKRNKLALAAKRSQLDTQQNQASLASWLPIAARFIASSCVRLALLLILLLVTPVATALAQTNDPLSVVERYWAAADALDVEAIMSLYADDAVFTGTRGVQSVGKNAIRRIEQGAVNAGFQGMLKRNFHVSGDAVTWQGGGTSVFWEKLGVVPVRTRGRAVVKDGKIKSFAVYYLPESLARMQRACESPQGQGVLIFSSPCNEFVQQAIAWTKSVAAALKPFSVETDYESLRSYLSPIAR